jgi:hypothetical protein
MWPLPVFQRATGMSQQNDRLSYVLITPAHNEAKSIGKTIQAVINQTQLPFKWIIVSDGSTDQTVAIVRTFLARYPWIELIELPTRESRSFAGKVRTFNSGYERVKHLNYDVIGNLDADLSFESDYFQFLMAQFAADPLLGVAGTIFKEDGGYSSDSDSFEGQTHVPGGCQLFRKQCFEHIGGYAPTRVGGIDWIAVTTARMRGWKTRAFRDRFFFHHRSLGTAGRSRLAASFHYGEKDYCLGGHPLWEMIRVVYKMTKRPYILGGAALGLGYLTAVWGRTPRVVSDELMRFHRTEQMAKLKTIVKALSRFERVDSFRVMQS